MESIRQINLEDGEKLLRDYPDYDLKRVLDIFDRIDDHYSNDNEKLLQL